MVTVAKARALALSFQDCLEKPHFERPSFRIGNKIFLTLDVQKQFACLKLSPVDQSVFTSFDVNIFYPVPNAWGKQGWTYVDLKSVRMDMFKDALTCAFMAVAKKKSAKR